MGSVFKAVLSPVTSLLGGGKVKTPKVAPVITDDTPEVKEAARLETLKMRNRRGIAGTILTGPQGVSGESLFKSGIGGDIITPPTVPTVKKPLKVAAIPTAPKFDLTGFLGGLKNLKNFGGVAL